MYYVFGVAKFSIYVHTYDDIYYWVYHAVYAVPIYTYSYTVAIHKYIFSNVFPISIQSVCHMEQIYVKLYRLNSGATRALTLCCPALLGIRINIGNELYVQ